MKNEKQVKERREWENKSTWLKEFPSSGIQRIKKERKKGYIKGKRMRKMNLENQPLERIINHKNEFPIT